MTESSLYYALMAGGEDAPALDSDPFALGWEAAQRGEAQEDMPTRFRRSERSRTQWLDGWREWCEANPPAPIVQSRVRSAKSSKLSEWLAE